VESFTIKHVNLVICTGPGLSSQVKKMGVRCPVHTIFDMSSSKVEASPEKTAAINARLRLSNDEILVTYVGSFAVYQGIELMFEAIPLVAASSRNVRFVIIGGSNDEIAERKQVLAGEGVDAQVTFLGNVAPDELPNYLSASDVLLVPRLSGVNTPLKVLDYFKSGGAIVATDVPSNQIILNKATALFAQPNAESFAEKILVLAEDDGLRTHLGNNGRRLYEQKYNFEAFQKRIKKAYNELWFDF
jgi:glycosyltransferase involved in cell wall biosynthesis